jgi:hypothetical protein
VALLLLGAGPLIAAGILLWYVRSGSLARRVERGLSAELGTPVRIAGLRVRSWSQYALARFSVSAGANEHFLFKAEDGLLQTEEGWRLSFSRATVNLGEREALSGWARLLRSPSGSRPFQMVAETVRVGGGPPDLGRERLRLRGELNLGRERRRAFLHAITSTGRPMNLLVQNTPEGFTLSLSPKPLLLGVDRVAGFTGWPRALLPADLTGEVAFTEGTVGFRCRLQAEGALDLRELARQLDYAECGGLVTLTVNVERSLGTGSASSRGSVAVSLAEGPARVDGLALEAFRYVLFGQLSKTPVEEDVWTVDELAFTVTLEGDRVRIAGEDGPILRARSQRGNGLELWTPALTTTEELARRSRLALPLEGVGLSGVSLPGPKEALTAPVP